MALHVGLILDESINLVMHRNRAQIFEHISHPPKIFHRQNLLNNSGPVPMHYQIYSLIQNWPACRAITLSYCLLHNRFLLMLDLWHAVVNIYLQILIV